MIVFETMKDFEDAVMKIVTQRLKAEANMSTESVYCGDDAGYLNFPVVNDIWFYDDNPTTECEDRNG